MSTPIIIRDGTGTNVRVGATSEHALRVSNITPPGHEIDAKILTRYKILRDFFINSSGSPNLNVNGSVTSVPFNFSSTTGKIRYVTSLRFIFNDGNMDMSTSGQARRFGDAAAAPGLTNGLTMTISQGGIITNVFASTVQNIGDFLNYADDFVNIIDAISNGVDFLSFDFKFEQPIVLTTDNLDTITITVQDNLTAVDFFQILVRGYQEII